MPSSIPTPKFLLDENVRIELYKFLKQLGLDVKVTPKEAQDSELMSISRLESRILVTNDQDFSNCTKDEVFSVVWLKIPQNDSEALIFSFSELINGVHKFEGKLIMLEKGKWRDFPLIKKVYV